MAAPIEFYFEFASPYGYLASTRIDRIAVTVAGASPTGPSAEVAAHNPLGKIPALVLEDGTALYDSRVICEYLDGLSSGPHLFPEGAARWDALTRQAESGLNARLRAISADSGGGQFELDRDDDLSAAFGRVAEELGNQYLLGFTPAALDGREHRLEVRLTTRRSRRTSREALAVAPGSTRGRHHTEGRRTYHRQCASVEKFVSVMVTASERPSPSARGSIAPLHDRPRVAIARRRSAVASA